MRKLWPDSAIAAAAVIAALLSVLLPSPLLAQQQCFVSARHVAFTIYPEEKSHKIGEPIVIRYTIKNISKKALFVPRSVWDVKCGSWPHVWAWLKNSSGKKFMPGYAWSCLGSSGTFEERIAKDAVLLKPKQQIRGSVEMDTKMFKAQLEPGVYRLGVGLTGWREEEFGEATRLQIVNMRHPFLQGEVTASTRIELTR